MAYLWTIGSFEVGTIEGVLGMEPGTAFGVMGRTDWFLAAAPLKAVETLKRVVFFILKGFNVFVNQLISKQFICKDVHLKVFFSVRLIFNFIYLINYPIYLICRTSVRIKS